MGGHGALFTLADIVNLNLKEKKLVKLLGTGGVIKPLVKSHYGH